MAKALRDGMIGFRIRIGALAPTEPGRVLFENEFFDDPPAGTGGSIKVWTGSAWVEKPVKVWTGSAWVTKPVKAWNGSAWVLA